MITSGGWLNPTRAIGLLSYGSATICCAVACIKTKGQSQYSRFAALLTFVESMLLLDVTFNWRWMLHQFITQVAQSRHEYELRHTPQVIAVTLLAAFLLLGLLAVLRGFLGKSGPSLAVAGALLSLIVWCTELVSLHAIDRFLYYQLGPIMMVSLFWIVACLLTSIGMLTVVRHDKSLRRR